MADQRNIDDVKHTEVAAIRGPVLFFGDFSSQTGIRSNRILGSRPLFRNV